MSLTHQFTAYISVGVFATLAHYGVLIGLVEGAFGRWFPPRCVAMSWAASSHMS